MQIIVVPRSWLRRGLLAATAGVLLLLVLWGLAVGGAWPAAAVERQVPVYEVATDQQQVAISFDASWGAEYTPAILDTLDEYGIKTTFFLVNIWIEDYPDLAREIAERGHEIGLHSASHPHFTELADGEIRQELSDNFDLIVATTGCQPTLFRPPFGDYDDRVVELVRSCGYQCVQWSVDSLDWKDLDAEQILRRVTKDIGAGDIVLFHNNGLHTAEALPLVLDYLRQEQLAVVPVGELLLDGSAHVDNNGVQHAGAAK